MGNSTSTTASSASSSSWHHYLAQWNNSRLWFDYANYIQERKELAQDLRLIAIHAAQHRQLQGSWQVVQGTASVTAGVASGVALLATTATALAALPVVAVAGIVGKSVAAASLASTAAMYTHGHVVQEDLAKRLRNLHHIIVSIAEKDQEINRYFVVVAVDGDANNNVEKNMNDSDQTNPHKGDRKEKSKPVASSEPRKNDETSRHEKESNATKPSKTEKHTQQNDTKEDARSPAKNDKSNTDKNAKTTIREVDKPKNKSPPSAIRACQALCQVWQDLVAQEDNQIKVVDLVVALVQSSSVILSAKSVIDGHVKTRQAHNLETALLQTADALDYETVAIEKLDLRYLRCIPTPRQLPRGRLLHIDGGNGQVTMMVTFDDDGSLDSTTLTSDSTRSIRLPYGATNVRVTFRDMAGKPVHKVDRANPQQPWIKDEKGRPILEECTFDTGDGVDAAFVVKGSLAHAYIHKAWDFGRDATKTPRSWEWWDDVDDRGDETNANKMVPIEVEQRKAHRETSEPIHDNSCGVALCCLTPQELMPFPMSA